MALQLIGSGSYLRATFCSAARIQWMLRLTAFLVFGLVSAQAGITVRVNLPIGHPGVAYSGSFTPSGGVAPYRLALDAGDGSLPRGLVLNSTSGAVIRTPVVTGVHNFVVVVTDSPGSTSRVHGQISITNSDSGSGVNISVTPTSSTLLSGQVQQFVATVKGTSNTAVTWAATGGTGSSGGLFTAPSVTSATSVTVTATSAADTTRKASAIVTVNAPAAVSVTIAPGSASLASGNTQQFSATVQGTSNTAVTWSANAGTVSSGGRVTAPHGTSSTNATLTATHAPDSTQHASATITGTPT